MLEGGNVNSATSNGELGKQEEVFMIRDGSVGNEQNKCLKLSNELNETTTTTEHHLQKNKTSTTTQTTTETDPVVDQVCNRIENSGSSSSSEG